MTDLTITLIDVPPGRLWDWKGQKKKTIDERFDEKCMAEPNSGCVIWLGAIDSKGYGLFRPNNERTVRAHIFSYKRTRGDYAADHQLDHLCRNTSCVNPDHLEPVTSAENQNRGIRARKGNYCKHGHLLEGLNVLTWIRPSGTTQRACRTCVIAYRKKYWRGRRTNVAA